VAGLDYRVNHRIRVPEVRLINEKGDQVGVVATKDARRMADEVGLDLVEVAPNARPPVCRILDYGKFKYQQRKKEKKGGHKHASALKELRVRPAIDPHDLSYRLDNGRRFLEAGHKVQVVCIFRGRQMAHPEHGYDVMRKVADTLGDISKVESQPRLMGRRMTMLLAHKPAPGKPVGKPAAKPAGAKSAASKAAAAGKEKGTAPKAPAEETETPGEAPRTEATG
jgi:translation initiation factor IF-3